MFRALFYSILVLPFALLSLISPTSGPSRPKIETRQTQYQRQPSPTSTLRVGWAYEAYPDAPQGAMQADFARMRLNGANAVWLGHNNPGEVDRNKVEPGLSYAVYEALQDANDPRHADAQAMADAVRSALDAARAAGLEVILPVGYQIQMGSAWNARHPDSLRRRADGTLMNLFNSGSTASPYDAQYRADIRRYYEWIQQEWVAPYHDVIAMLSLADEPMGGDYSAAAQRAFAEKYGKAVEQLPPAEQWQWGEFQAGVIVDYAVWSAQVWSELNPDLPTTMSFHGGDTARRVWGLPDLERLFAETPENFVITFDAYLHDDLAAKPATADEAAQLKLFLATVGHYSKVYDKPLALWGGANAWGLAQASDSPRGIPDAVSNLFLLYDVPSRMGANLWGIFAWNYNVKQQGLYNYALPTSYDPAALETAVSRVLPLLRQRRTGALAAPEIAIYVSPRTLYQALASSRASDAPPAWFDATPYARAFADRDAVFVTSPRSLKAAEGARWLIVPEQGMDTAPEVLALIRAQFERGGIVLAHQSVAAALGLPTGPWQDPFSSLPLKSRVVYTFR